MIAKKTLGLLAWLLSLVLLVTACQPAGQNTTKEELDSLAADTSQNGRAEKVIKIFYNVPSPLEMATLVQRDNASFYAELLSPVENLERFNTHANTALNIGVYGVDLSYAKIFGQNQKALKYLQAIKKLSNKLGIPQDDAENIFEKIEGNVENSDTLLKVINQTYNTADKYLKDNERETTASLIIVGGWIEAMYIATNIYKKEENPEDILERIVVQKLSLNTLIELLSNQQDDRVVAAYLQKLILIKKIYDKIEIKYTHSEVNIDTVKKVITIRGEEPLDVTDEQIEKISNLVASLRHAIVK